MLSPVRTREKVHVKAPIAADDPLSVHVPAVSFKNAERKGSHAQRWEGMQACVAGGAGIKVKPLLCMGNKHVHFKGAFQSVN